ncbi:hypothetical protein SynA1560_02036 [Synechococcus sp. A15-60]|nr:hypothetical protein SynA1560_02036 [Synechococcus sp. A15-60]
MGSVAKLEAFGSRRPGAIRARDWVVSCEGTEEGASQESIGVTDLCVDIQESTQIGVETVRA